MANENGWDGRFFSSQKEEPSTLPQEITPTLVQTEVLNPLNSLSEKVERMNKVASTTGSEKAKVDLAQCESIIWSTIHGTPRLTEPLENQFNKGPGFKNN